MSIILDPLQMPLWGSRLIEASAGTGKTWTIAALYLRLILGHHQPDQPSFAPLLPENILVMTFTRAATQELKERIRERLQEAARYFRHPEQIQADKFLEDLLQDYPDPAQRQLAAWRLSLAADAMDQSAIFTIDAWCQRSLREHALLTGSDSRETLLQNEEDLLEDAMRDFWRQEIYPLPENLLEAMLAVFQDPGKMQESITPLLKKAASLPVPTLTLNDYLSRTLEEPRQQLQALKQRWAAHQEDLRVWLLQILDGPKSPLNGRKYKTASIEPIFQALQDWLDSAVTINIKSDKCQLLCASHLQANVNKNEQVTPPESAHVLETILAELDLLQDAFDNIHKQLQVHAAAWVQQRLHTLKAIRHQLSHQDYLRRLAGILRDPLHAAPLIRRLQSRYPVAMIDEFQDTSALQYQVFDAIYSTADNHPERLLLLIGDPKQSIYRFRGADIDSYLRVRRLTTGRHYILDKNFRSSAALVATLNALYHGAESREPQGAFAYVEAHDKAPSGSAPHPENPLPYWPVQAQGKHWQWQLHGRPGSALSIWAAEQELNKDEYLHYAAEQAAESMAQILADPDSGFSNDRCAPPAFRRARGKDMAVLVRDRHEAACIRAALQRRRLRSVYLSEKDSVYSSPEAHNLLLWLEAVADPENTQRLRVALALPLLGLSHQELDAFNREENVWEEQLANFQDLSRRWRRQGVLAMLHHSIHHFGIARRLLQQTDGERRLTNLLQLGELLQTASATREGPEALIHFLREAISVGHDQSDAHILRLESDAELIRVVTIHAAKGLQYPLVFLPFIATYKKAKSEAFQIRQEGAAAEIIWETEGSDAAERARLQEDLRLLYVALTRAEYALFLGLAKPSSGKSPIFNQSAIAYLLGKQRHDADLWALLQQLQDNPDIRENIQIMPLPAEVPVTEITETASAPTTTIPEYPARFDKNWGVASFSALIRDLPASPFTPAQRASQGPAWHRYPPGMQAGTFLHEQLQKLAGQGFATILEPDAGARIQRDCALADLSDWSEATLEWLRAIVQTPLLDTGITLMHLQHYQSEMAFWFPSAELRSKELDQLCRSHLFPQEQRPRLPDRVLHGMMRGFMDLVFVQQDRYYVLDYKSNLLGAQDADYDALHLRAQTLRHRYELQACLYQLALHRLLRQRLGQHYQPERHLGGTLLFFLRGIQGPQRGMLHLPADIALIDAMDRLFAVGELVS
ncbi:exodeoxyribonuclease V subunit beta [Acidithiobacillus marinus]|uniref:RecBCD enzyme subunit RecB n=1 Tax=Acidithiobacillus marinus TaxID=187490 RepID=A0A2I1DM68_9PROT|nr:exodeoxyribonuclease V subunit beta [Acidithiobacillus marinus]PKY10957.1 exodeoxyribonuclease V subunit beta [Acidithiobacillus marinus]